MKRLAKEVLIVVPGKAKNIGWERLERMIGSNYLTHRIALYLLRIPPVHKIYRSLKVKSEFNSRISQINPDEYLDVSSKPELNVILLVIDSLPHLCSMSLHCYCLKRLCHHGLRIRQFDCLLDPSDALVPHCAAATLATPHVIPQPKTTPRLYLLLDIDPVIVLL